MHVPCRYMAAFRRSLTDFQRLGWKNFEIAYEGNPDIGSLVHKADIVICRAQAYSLVQHSSKRFIVVDDADSATLKLYDFLKQDDPLLLGVLKPAILQPLALQRGPLVKSKVHYANILLAHNNVTGVKYRSISDSVLSKVHALIPMLWLWRFPLECGGNLNYLRFNNFFRPGRRSARHSLSQIVLFHRFSPLSTADTTCYRLYFGIIAYQTLPLFLPFLQCLPDLENFEYTLESSEQILKCHKAYLVWPPIHLWELPQVCSVLFMEIGRYFVRRTTQFLFLGSPPPGATMKFPLPYTPYLADKGT